MGNITRDERIRRKLIKHAGMDVQDAQIIKETKNTNNMAEKANEKKAQETADSSASEIKVEAPAAPKAPRPKPDTNPFDSSVSQKDYAHQAVETKGEMPESIPEPQFQKRVIDFDQTGKGSEEQQEQQGDNTGDPGIDDDSQMYGNGSDEQQEEESQEEYKQPKGDFLGDIHNPGMQDMTTKESKEATNDLVETIVTGLDWAAELLKNSCTISKQKLQQKALKGRFDMTALEIPLLEEEGGGTMWDSIEQINQIASEGFTIDEQWKQDVKVPLRKILLKKGIGITPEQQLAFYGIQLGIKWIGTFATLKIAQRQIFEALNRISKDVKDARPSSSNSPRAEPIRTAQDDRKEDTSKIPTAEEIHEKVS